MDNSCELDLEIFDGFSARWVVDVEVDLNFLTGCVSFFFQLDYCFTFRSAKTFETANFHSEFLSEVRIDSAACMVYQLALIDTVYWLVKVKWVVSAQLRCLVVKVSDVYQVAGLQLGHKIEWARQTVVFELAHYTLGYQVRKVQIKGVLALAA